MAFADFLLELSESGFWGQVLVSIILITIVVFAINIVCIPYRINKIKNDVEAIKNIIAKSVVHKNANEKGKIND